MPRILYKDYAVTGVANQEVLTDALTSSQKEKYRILGVMVVETTATENNDAILRCYHDRERIVDFSIKHLLDKMDAETASSRRFIDLDESLPVGHTFQVGHESGSTLSTLRFCVKYTIEGAA